MSRGELQSVIDYILNKADPNEFEVIVKACERRRRDLTAFAGLGGQGPAGMAKRMAGELQENMGASMESLRGTVRDYVAQIIRQNAPEIGEDELAALLDEYAPPPDRARKKAAASPLPPEALLPMINSFVEYSKGAMAPSRQRELWQSDQRWQDSYWAAFPAEIKALVKAFVEGRIDDETFGSGVLSLLGL